MQFSFDEKCSSSEKIAKNLIEETLDYVDSSKSKRKDCVRDSLKKNDEALVPIFDKMIERKAILTHSEKINGRIRTMLSTAPRNLVFYSIKKMVNTVPSEEEMKEAFMLAWVNGTSQMPANCKKFEYLKKEKDSFDLFMKLPFGDFYLLASYCFCEYDRIVQKKATELQKKIDEINPVQKTKSVQKPANETKKVEEKPTPSVAVKEPAPSVVVDEVTETIIDVMSKEKDKQAEPKKESVATPCEGGVMETIFENMSKFNKNECKTGSEFDKYRNKREEMRKSVADKIDALHMLTDINAYLKFSFIELKRMLDPALFRGNQYSNLKYSNNEVFECGFDNTNVMMTKISFDISSLEKIKSIVDNALEVKKVFEDAKSCFEDGMTKEELEVVKNLAK